ncbi:hypothetical protein JCM10449v2_000452 [Rhodotorula kratochvilovae]
MVQIEQVVFNSIPKGKPVPGETLKKVTKELDLDAPLQDGEVLLKTLTLSLDPYLRGRMRDEGIDSYVPAFKVGAPIANFGVGEVLNSSNPKFKKGDHVYGSLEFATYQVISKDAANGLAVLENKEGLPWTTWVGAAGMPGQTAWWGVEKIAKVKKGDTVFVSGAMGPVGQVTIGLAHRLGAKVIASAGSEEKVKFLRETYGVERAFNYKTEDPNKVLGDWAKENGPFTVYVDNTAGPQLEAALAHIAKGGRIVAIGAVNDYNGNPYGIKNVFHVVAKELKYEGFIILNHMTPENLKAFYDEVPKYLADGSIPVKEHVFKGLDNGESFATLFDQDNSNFGKAVISLE